MIVLSELQNGILFAIQFDQDRITETDSVRSEYNNWNRFSLIRIENMKRFRNNEWSKRENWNQVVNESGRLIPSGWR